MVLLVVAGFLGFRAYRATVAARSALQSVRALQGTDRAALDTLDPDGLAGLRDRFAALERDLREIERQASPFLGLTPALGWLPGVGEEAVAAPELLQLGQQTAAAGRSALEGALMVLEASQEEGEGSALARVAAALERAQPNWQAAEAALDDVAAIRARLDPSSLDPRLSGPLAQLDGYLPMLRTAVALGQVAPALLGTDQPRTYLLLAQNSDELRPTGGFISGVGLMTVDGGELGELEFDDSYAVFNPNIDHPLAPPDLERTMGAQMLLFRDSNWSADFPTAANVAQSLYQLDRGVATDGVFAFDLEAARRLLRAVEPLTLPGYAEPVTSQNLTAALRDVWEAPVAVESTVAERDTSDWWLHRKDFMGDLAAAARAKVEAGEVDLGALAQALYSALEEKHILLSVADPATMALLEETGWAGAVTPGDGDFLLVVDSNVGWNKVNPLIDRATSYVVRPLPDGGVEAELRLTYTHGGQPDGEPCIHEPRYGDSYEAMQRRCYFNYLRVYTPAGTRLLDAQGFEPDSVGQASAEAGATLLSGLVVVPPGATHEVVLRYQLPAAGLAGGRYRLRLQKQPGVPAWPVEIAIDDPTGAWRLVGQDSVANSGLSGYAQKLATDVDLVFEKVPSQ